jgi:hypothetical protein
MQHQLTHAELALMELTGTLANAFCALPEPEYKGHVNDLPDAYQHIRALQNIILSRCSMRIYVAMAPYTADKNKADGPYTATDEPAGAPDKDR